MTETTDTRINSSDAYSCLIGEVCQECNISLTCYEGGWLKRLEKDHEHRFIVGYNIGLNNATSSTLASDKAAASQILHRAGIPTVPHQIFYSPDNREPYATGRNSLALIAEYLHQHRDSIVLKPNCGTTGQRVYHVTDADEITPAVSSIFSADYWHDAADAGAMSPFYDIEHEYRMIMLDGEARLVYQKSVSKSSDWKFNLSQGATAEKIVSTTLKNQLVTMAQAATRALNLRFCSVDIIKTTDGELLVLEVNSGVSVGGYLKQHAEDYEVVKQIFREAISKVFA